MIAGCKFAGVPHQIDYTRPFTKYTVAVKLVCHAALGLYMLSVNRSRDRQLQNKGDVDEEVKREAERNGMLDQTEFENRAFRYVL